MWNEDVQVNLVDMVRSHVMRFLFNTFRKETENVTLSENIRANFRVMCNVVGSFELYVGPLLRNDIFTSYSFLFCMHS